MNTLHDLSGCLKAVPCQDKTHLRVVGYNDVRDAVKKLKHDIESVRGNIHLSNDKILALDFVLSHIDVVFGKWEE
jgi:hypothetical protein